MKKHLAAALFLGAALALTLNAEDVSTSAETAEQDPLKYQIIVTATRTEQPELHLGSSTTLLPIEDLRRSGKRTVAEALACVPGLDLLQSGGLGTHASLFIRGANTEHTLILVDGTELNDPVSPGRAGDISHLTLDNVERIEIVRGPQSTLYGSDAMSGVIQIITKKGAGKPKIRLSAEGGSFNTFHESAGISGGDENIHYSAELSRTDSQGFSSAAEEYGNTEKDGYGNTTVSAKMGAKPAKNLEFQVNTRYIHSRTDLDNAPGPLGDDPNYVSTSSQWIASLHSRLLLLNNQWEQKLDITYNNNHRELRDDTDSLRPFDASVGVYQSSVFKIDWQNNLHLPPNHAVTAGFELSRENGRSEYAWTSPWGDGQSNFPNVGATTWSAYLQDNINIKNTLFASFGLRYDHHDLFGGRATFRIAPALVLKSGTKLKTTLGTGFKAPSLYHLYAPATMWGPVGNPELKPETSTGWDVGIEQSLLDESLSIGLTYFHNSYTNLIEYNWISGYSNQARAITEGLECTLSATPVNKLSIKSSYTYTKTRDKTSNLPLLRRPAHKAAIDITRQWSKSTLAINASYTGKRDDLFPYPTRITTKDYILINLSASHKLSNNLEIFARLDNVLNTSYQAVTGYGSPKRSFRLGFRVN